MTEINGSVDINILKNLAAEYQALNGQHIETIDDITPLEFMRKVHIGRPVIIKGHTVPALEKWNTEYLLRVMDGDEISIAVTPDGRADAIVTADNGIDYFVEPHTELMTMDDFLQRIQSSPNTHYLQSQNGNLYNASSEGTGEFKKLHVDVPRDIPWATAAFDMSPDAVNIWIGDDRSVTSIHSDPYENIYTVVQGVKHFTLFPPTEGWRMKERLYPHARYTRETPDGDLRMRYSDSTTPRVRWSSIKNPLDATELPLESNSFHISLHSGETLYLPAGWWHYVRQSGLTIAINWWYDMEARGMTWVWLNFLRGETGSLLSAEDEEEEKQSSCGGTPS